MERFEDVQKQLNANRVGAIKADRKLFEVSATVVSDLGYGHRCLYLGTMSQSDFEALVSCLIDDQPPRVWSLLVTVFGDMAQQQDMRVGSGFLAQLTGRIGIKPEAVRVALHRLRKDGWIDSQRNGRSSTYGLTDWGRTQSAEASPRIYSSSGPVQDVWLIATDPAGPTVKHQLEDAWIAPNLRLSLTRPDTPDQLVARLDRAATVPAWVRLRSCKPATLDAARDLADRLDRVSRLLSKTGALTPLDIAVLRVLIVHSWRRLLFKTPDLPDHIFSGGWAGPRCRKRVAELLSVLPRQNLRDIEEHAPGSNQS